MAASSSGSVTSTHDQIIEALALESRAPLKHVRALFEDAYSRLQSDARVHTFVSVIATRLVRRTLHAERADRG